MMPSDQVRVCTACGEENLAWASFCTGCGGSLTDARLVVRRRAIRIPPAMAAGVVLCAVAFVVLWMLLRMLPTSSAVGGPKTLDVLWHKFYGTASEEWIVGEVENRSNRTLTGVLACGEYYAGDGRTIETAIRPLDQAVLLPGQKSHFKIVAPYESEIEQSWFHFQTMDGEQLSFRR